MVPKNLSRRVPECNLSEDHRNFIQMNWLPEFHLPLPRVRAKKSWDSPSQQVWFQKTEQRPIIRAYGFIYLVLVAICVVFVMGHRPELFPNHLCIILFLWVRDCNVPLKIRKVPRGLSKGNKEKTQQCSWQSHSRVRKVTRLDPSFALTLETEIPHRRDTLTWLTWPWCLTAFLQNDSKSVFVCLPREAAREGGLA